VHSIKTLSESTAIAKAVTNFQFHKTQDVSWWITWLFASHKWSSWCESIRLQCRPALLICVLMGPEAEVIKIKGLMQPLLEALYL